MHFLILTTIQKNNDLINSYKNITAHNKKLWAVIIVKAMSIIIPLRHGYYATKEPQ